MCSVNAIESGKIHFIVSVIEALSRQCGLPVYKVGKCAKKRVINTVSKTNLYVIIGKTFQKYGGLHAKENLNYY